MVRTNRRNKSERQQSSSKRVKQSTSNNETPSASFLAALAAQRANQAQKQDESSTLRPKPKDIPGFCYDEKQNRYFKQSKQRPYTHTGQSSNIIRRDHFPTSGWTRFLAERERGNHKRGDEHSIYTLLYRTRLVCCD